MNFNITLRVLLVEDNPGFTQLLEILLKDIGIQQIQIANNYENGLQRFLQFEPDICIFDIDLGKDARSGIELANQIRASNYHLPIIYITANYNEDFYQRTRHTYPSAFLNKELSKFKMEQAIDIALMHKKDLLNNPGIISLKSAPLIAPQQFFFKIGDIFKAIQVKDISYFYADNKLTYAQAGARNYPTNVQLKTIEDEFAHQFARIHKSYLVNLDHIDSIQPKDNTIIVKGETLPIGYAFRKPFFNRLNLLK